jgi:hypothetical protein
MVSYEDWIGATHEAYKEMGGVYDGSTATELVQIASEFWNRNKDELKQIARREAVRIAKRMINNEIGQ